MNKIHVKSIIDMYLIDCSVPRSWAASELWLLVARRVSSQADCSLPRSWAALTASVGKAMLFAVVGFRHSLSRFSGYSFS